MSVTVGTILLLYSLWRMTVPPVEFCMGGRFRTSVFCGVPITGTSRIREGGGAVLDK